MKAWKSIAMTIALATVMSTAAIAQFSAPTTGSTEGSLTVSFQNYYNRTNGQTVFNAQGGGVRFRRFFPKRGLLSLQVEPLLSNGKFGFGENYLSFTGVPWKGKHWDLYGGEFRTESMLVDNPFLNYQQPQIGIRGGRVIARTGKWTASAFAGQESLSQGSRISFRKTAPQLATGAQLSGSVNETIQLGFRFLQLNTSNDNSERTRSLFPTGRRVLSSTSGTVQASVKATRNLRLYSEVSLNRSKLSAGMVTRPENISWVAGPAYVSDRYTLRANYIRQGYGYMPAAGYYLGDRQGPSVDGSVHFGRVGMAANWLQSRNDIERDTNIPDFFSRQASGNVYVRLPLEFYVGGSYSQLALRTESPDGIFHNSHKQYQAQLSRRLYRHYLRLSWTGTDLNMRGTYQKLTSWEAEDSFNWLGITASAAVRLQRVAGDESKQTYYTRSSANWSRGRFSIYGNWELGKDLANQSIFSTTTATSSVVGMGWEAPSGVAIRLEGFRTTNSTMLNTQNLFLLSTRGIVPDTLLNHSNDWNIYMRVSREIGWGSHVFDGQSGMLSAQAPLVGSISGFVKLHTLAGDLPAANVWVETDTGVRARTDQTGYYAIPEILQGKRTVKLDEDRLPADYSPTGATSLLVDVKADQMSRADLVVAPLVYFEGVVRDQDGAPAPGGVMIGLNTDGQQTTTDDKGRFGFFNLAEGDYEITVLSETLPDETPINSSKSARVSLRYGQPVPYVELRMEVAREAPKPVKEVNLGTVVKAVQVKAPVAVKGQAARKNLRNQPAPPAAIVVISPVPAAAPAVAPAARGRRVLSSTAPAAERGKTASSAGKPPVGSRPAPRLMAANTESGVDTAAPLKRLHSTSTID